MRVQNNDQLADRLLAEMVEDDAEDRSAMHPSVTDLIYCLTQSYYNYIAPVKLESTRQTKIYFLTGLGLERNLLRQRKKKQGYGQYWGVHFHVDTVDEELVELKSTRMSVKKVETEIPMRWLRQIMSYLMPLNELEGRLEAELAVIYLIPGDFRVYRLTFTQEELDANWEWMMERKQVWDESETTGVPPEQFKWNESWECDSCQWKMVCDMRERNASK